MDLFLFVRRFCDVSSVVNLPPSFAFSTGDICCTIHRYCIRGTFFIYFYSVTISCNYLERASGLRQPLGLLLSIKPFALLELVFRRSVDEDGFTDMEVFLKTNFVVEVSFVDLLRLAQFLPVRVFMFTSLLKSSCCSFLVGIFVETSD